MREIWHISIHCSASDNLNHNNLITIYNWHIERGWSDIGYHYVILKNGDIEEGRPINKIPAAVKNHNEGQIAICLTGYKQFSKLQFNSLNRLVRSLMFEYGIKKENVKGHNQYEGHFERECPCFDIDEVLWKINNLDPKEEKENMNIIKQILTNNSGVSVKSFAVFSGVVIAVLTVIAILVLLYLDFFYEKSLNINLQQLAIFVGSIEAIIAVLMGLKVYAEKQEK